MIAARQWNARGADRRRQGAACMSEIDDREIRRLRTDVAGEVLRPTDAGYDAARSVWNGAIDRRPAVIVRCLNSADVAQAIAFARRARLEIAVRGGGHNYAGFAVCDGGLVIDLSRMNGVRVDTAARF